MDHVLSTQLTNSKTSTWNVDPAHSSVGFSVRHLMITTIKGLFSQYDAQIVWNDDDLTQSSVVAHIDTNSISTGDAYRDQHLRTFDFLNVENCPEMTFKSTHIERVSDEEYKIYGDLTCRAVTKEVKLDTSY